MTRVLIAGGGAREHALAWACARSGSGPEVLCAPGNAGTAELAENLPLAADDVNALAAVVAQRQVDLLVIGTEAAAAAGLAEAAAAGGAAVFGPTAAAARIETSKVFAKRLMDGAGIPTARWVSGRREDRSRLLGFAGDLGGGCAVKADGMALGKGVAVCDSMAEVETALAACFDERRFGSAGEEVVIEERLGGRELSVLAVCDGLHAQLLPPACDYKRALDGDQGPNTGGMGAHTPPGELDLARLLADVESRVMNPCLDALRQVGTPFRGCLFAGLMLTQEGIRVLEFNARFGDPEAQVILPLLEPDILELLLAAARGGVSPGRVGASDRAAVGVVAASAGYPGEVRTGLEVSGLESLEPDVLCFHGGTRRGAGGQVETSGGRVLTLVATATTLEDARSQAYANLDRISFEGMRCRRDIAAAPAPAGAPA